MNIDEEDNGEAVEEKEEREEEKEREEEEKERDGLTDELKVTCKDGRRVRKRNDLLKRCLREFFRKRKLEHICKEQEVSSLQIEAAYEAKLNNYARVRSSHEAELREKRDEETRLDEARNMWERVWTQRFETLKTSELDAALRCLGEAKPTRRDGLMKKLTKLIEAQWETYQAEGVTRIAELKLREKIRAGETKLKQVDSIDENVQIYDYERVLAENERIQAEIDEKISQMKRIEDSNSKVQVSVSQLRRKIDSLKSRTDNLSSNLEILHGTMEKTLAQYKQTVQIRDTKRHLAVYLTDHAEMNLHPRLIRDFHDKTERLKTLNEEIAQQEQSLAQWREKIDKIGAVEKPPRTASADPLHRSDLADRFKLNRSKLNYWSRSKSRSSDDSSTIQSSLSFSFNARKLQLLE